MTDEERKDAELIVWQYRVKQSGWSEWYDAAPTKAEAISYIESLQRFGLVGEYELRPLYTVPPRPDVSAELIGAAERELNNIRDCMLDRSSYYGRMEFAGDIEKVAIMLRSGK